MRDDPPHLPHDNTLGDHEPTPEAGQEHQDSSEAGEALTKERFAELADPAGDLTDPVARSMVRAREAISRASHRHLDQRRAELHRDTLEKKLGPRGEARSEAITKRVEMIPLEKIRDDPTFHNIRLAADSEKLAELAGSMQREGQKVPVLLITAAPPEPWFYVRAGFRRVLVARQLKWRRVAAVVLPDDTPVVDEYWTNIIENSSREQLTTYELASAARTMRDKFAVGCREFAQRAGYSESHVAKLLRCIDTLPKEIVDEWRGAAPIPIDVYYKWSSLLPNEAIREMLTYTNRYPKVVREWSPPPEVRERAHPIKMASARGLSRMQKLRLAAETQRELSERERTLCLQVIDYCSGARDDVPGVYEEEKKKRAQEDRLRKEAEDTSAPPENVAQAAALATASPTTND